MTCAGRTDRGVHARGQVAHFDTEASRPDAAWVRGTMGQAVSMTATLEILALGELEVRYDGKTLALPPSRKTRALLAYLALTGRSHRRERGLRHGTARDDARLAELELAGRREGVAVGRPAEAGLPEGVLSMIPGHGAAQSEVAPSWDHPEHWFQTNTVALALATTTELETFLKANGVDPAALHLSATFDAEWREQGRRWRAAPARCVNSATLCP